MPFAPVTFTRIDANHYVVGRVHLVRAYPESGPRWEARPDNDATERPLFTAGTLEEILDMAHGAVEMMRPATTPARHRDDYDPDPDYDRPTRYDIGPDGEV